jgi:hypothetical protein
VCCNGRREGFGNGRVVHDLGHGVRY